ncbi:DUF433 domain-containing protein [Chloroflexi bacterium TSY]|nr:DUF433 domain-containing protein [Chloroflexi bacterium TSY]
MNESTKPLILGRYIVADPEICHGKPTFRGTRIMVADVLEQVAEGMAWETIIEGWHDSITKEAITEAVQLARESFLKHIEEFALEPMAA